MSSEPFFRKDGDLFVPTPISAGPWNPNSLHGRLIVGLLGAEIEKRHRTPEYLPARLTVDMYRLPDLSPVVVKTTVVRDGFRIKVIDAEFISDGVSCGRATCQLLRKTENPPGNIWRPEPWDAPRPGDMPEPDAAQGFRGMWAMKPVVGGFGAVGERKCWMSEVRELVEGEALTPYANLVTGADFVSPYANAGDQGLHYINSDVTIYLHREPVSMWVGYEVINHGATDGIAIGECFLHDEEGPIGQASCTALAQKLKV